VSRDRQEGENVEIRHIPASNILIAEDNPDDAFFLERAFAKSGIASRLFFVKDGQEVVDYLQGDKPFDDRAVWPFPDLSAVGPEDAAIQRSTGPEMAARAAGAEKAARCGADGHGCAR